MAPARKRARPARTSSHATAGRALSTGLLVREKWGRKNCVSHAVEADPCRVLRVGPYAA
jgi:hypothetical protein